MVRPTRVRGVDQERSHWCACSSPRPGRFLAEPCAIEPISDPAKTTTGPFFMGRSGEELRSTRGRLGSAVGSNGGESTEPSSTSTPSGPMGSNNFAHSWASWSLKIGTSPGGVGSNGDGVSATSATSSAAVLSVASMEVDINADEGGAKAVGRRASKRRSQWLQEMERV